MSNRILQPSFTRTDARGVLTELLNEGRWESILTGAMHSGAVIGNHYHQETLVFFFLLSGAAEVKTIHVETHERDQFRLKANEGVLLPVNESHAIAFTEYSTFLMLKSKQYDPQHPDTIAYPVD